MRAHSAVSVARTTRPSRRPGERPAIARLRRDACAEASTNGGGRAPLRAPAAAPRPNPCNPRSSAGDVRVFQREGSALAACVLAASMLALRPATRGGLSENKEEHRGDDGNDLTRGGKEGEVFPGGCEAGVGEPVPGADAQPLHERRPRQAGDRDTCRDDGSVVHGIPPLHFRASRRSYMPPQMRRLNLACRADYRLWLLPLPVVLPPGL